MSIQTQSFSAIVQNAVTAIQGAANALLDLTVGSVLRAVVQAVAAITMWLQGVALQIASLTRFATSSGTDADSWAADFGFVRLLARSSTGQVTFARFTTTQPARIQAAVSGGAGANGQTIWTGGALVQTADGTQQFMVIPDAGQSGYNSTQNAYLIAAGTSSTIATVQAVGTGVATNVSSGTITLLAQAVSYVDTVNNASAMTGGADAETDAAFRTRFVQWLASLSKATVSAINTAINGVQAGLIYSVTENLSYGGSVDMGYFYVIVDDGTGSPPPALLTNVSLAINAVRPINSTFGVFGPVVVNANVGMTLTTSAGYVHSAIVSQVQSALTAFINLLPIGGTLPYTRLAQIAYDASPGVTNVSSVTLNGVTTDLTCTSLQVIKTGTLTVA